MSRIFKRLYKITVSMLLVASAIAYTPQQVMAITETPPGSVEIDKVRDAGTDGVFEITLTVDGVSVVTPTDVILVVDTSGSMSGSKMTSLKNAANNFVDLVLDENDGHRIGIVSFATGTSIVANLTDVKATLTSAINGLSANGGTHLEGGLKEAIDILDATVAPGRNKAIVVMSDGEPTYGFNFDMGEYTGPSTGSAQWQSIGGSWHCILPVTDADRDNDANYSGDRFDFDYNATVGTGNSINFTKSIPADDETCSFMGNTYTAVVRRSFSLDESVIEIASQANASYSIFSIGLDVDATGQAVLEAIQTKGYFAATTANLEAIYEEIASSLNFAATNAVVTDVIGEHFDYVGVSAGYGAEDVSYNLPTKTLTWNVGNVGDTPRILKYEVSLHNDAPGGTWPTNEWADLDYTDWQGNLQNEEFPVPEVLVGYIVELEANPEIGGSVSGEGRFMPGAEVDIVATAAIGFTFINWQEDEGIGNSTNSSHKFEMPEHNVKWIANFRENEEVTINYEATLGGSVTLASETLAPVTDDAVGSTAQANVGYSFVNWTRDGLEVSTDLSYIPPRMCGINVAATYVANFVEDEDVIINYIARPGGSVDLASETLAPVTDDAIGSTAAPDTGFAFINWTDEDDDIVSTLLEIIPDRVDGLNVAATYYANFEVVDYDFTFDPNWDDESNVIQVFNVGGSVAGTSFTREGYAFVGWATDQAGMSEYIGGLTNLPAQDIYVYAQWEAIDYTFTFDPNFGAGANVEQVFNVGGSVAGTSFTRDGFIFDGWTSDEEGLIPYVGGLTNLPAQDIYVYAQWEEIEEDEFVLTYVTNQPGLTIPSVVFLEGDTIVSPEPEAEGFVFLGWYMDEGLLVEFDDFDSMPAQDVTVYADWGEVLGDEDEVEEEEEELVPDMSDNNNYVHGGLFFLILGLFAIIATKKKEENA